MASKYMKTIGLLGGMSWESSLEYYRIINETVKRKLGGLHSAKSLMFSFDFYEIEELQAKGDWQSATEMMISGARQLESGGADFLIICTNTMHLMADEVANSVKIPLVHIADATGDRVLKSGLNRVALLGTKFTMEQDFYKGRLVEKYGLDVIVPDENDRQTIHDIIYNELCLGEVSDRSRKVFLEVIGRLETNGAEGVILGCTEIPLLIKQADVSLPLFDTTKIHAEVAVDFALKP